MKFTVIKVNEEIHSLIKHRAKYLGKKMGDYIADLVLDEIELAENKTRYNSNES